MDYRKKFAVDAGERPRLSKIDSSYTGKHESHEKALPEIQAHVEHIEIDRCIEWLKAAIFESPGATASAA